MLPANGTGFGARNSDYRARRQPESQTLAALFVVLWSAPQNQKFEEEKMRVGCPKEIKNHEYRVGLTPGAVREYSA
ncbi:hypothetical protein, partial [Mesorhizobium sp.]|uniref:hypothetical protein n=1 Tax=Mesorhizobium sp. TaxID=1871066 RepID=UPI0025EFC09C